MVGRCVLVFGLLAAACTNVQATRSADADVVDADVPTDREDVRDVTDITDVPDVGPQMTFTFVSAALVGGRPGEPQMRATISWHGMLRGENDAGVRLEAFFR